MNITGGFTADPSEGESQTRHLKPKGWRPKMSTLVVLVVVLVAIGGGVILWRVTQPAPAQTASAGCVLTGELPDPLDTPPITPVPSVGTVTTHSSGCVYDRVCFVIQPEGNFLAGFYGVHDPYQNPTDIPVAVGDPVRIEWALNEVQDYPNGSSIAFYALAVTSAPADVDIPPCPSVD